MTQGEKGEGGGAAEAIPDVQPAPQEPAQAAATPSAVQNGTPSSGSRFRQATRWKGVTATTGSNSGLQKFDVQFVFCDRGTKKHPKIYGFSCLDAAARGFDILTCKRALERGRTVASLVAGESALPTNHPSSEYQNEELLTFLEGISRDDCIYGLKLCAKKGHSLNANVMVCQFKSAVEASQEEAEDKKRMGDPRQSYEITAKGGERRRRNYLPRVSQPPQPLAPVVTTTTAAATPAPAGGSLQPDILAAAAAAVAAAMGQPFALPQAAPGDNAVTLTADDLLGQLFPASAPPGPPPASASHDATTAAAAALASHMPPKGNATSDKKEQDAAPPAQLPVTANGAATANAEDAAGPSAMQMDEVAAIEATAGSPPAVMPPSAAAHPQPSAQQLQLCLLQQSSMCSLPRL